MDVFRPFIPFTPITLSFEDFGEVHALRLVLRESLLRLGASTPADNARNFAAHVESSIVSNGATNQFVLVITSNAHRLALRHALAAVFTKAVDENLKNIARFIYSALDLVEGASTTVDFEATVLLT